MYLNLGICRQRKRPFKSCGSSQQVVSECLWLNEKQSFRPSSRHLPGPLSGVQAHRGGSQDRGHLVTWSAGSLDQILLERTALHDFIFGQMWFNTGHESECVGLTWCSLERFDVMWLTAAQDHYFDYPPHALTGTLLLFWWTLQSPSCRSTSM